MQGRRTFTGDANIRPGPSMDFLPADTRSQHASSTAVPAKQPASTQSAFTMGSGAAPVSPSKKRMHKDLKLRQTAPSSPSIQPAKANPFAQYGVNSGSSTQPSRSPSQRSPGKAQLGPSSPRRFKVALKTPNTAQSMHIDSNSMPSGTTSLSGMSSPTAAPHNHSTTAQPSCAPFPAGTASTSTGFPQMAVPANPFTSHHAASASFAFKPAVSGTAANPAAAAPSASSGPPNIGVRPDARPTTAATAAASATTASPAAVTPPSFRFGASHQRHASATSPKVPFQGFGAAGGSQCAAESPTAGFAGFQPGVHSKPVAFSVSASSIALRMVKLPCCRNCIVVKICWFMMSSVVGPNFEGTTCQLNVDKSQHQFSCNHACYIMTACFWCAHILPSQISAVTSCALCWAPAVRGRNANQFLLKPLCRGGPFLVSCMLGFAVLPVMPVMMALGDIMCMHLIQ